MSSSCKQKISCSNCGAEGEFTLWRSINTVLDPEMKAKVRDRTAFDYTCPVCGRTFNIDHEFLYHQMDDRIMIQYCQTEESLNNVMKFMTEFEASGDAMLRGMLDEGYIYRVVTDRNQLLEKLKIFDAGLDDRIIELTKAIYHVGLIKDPDAAELGELLWDQRGDESILVLFKKDGGILGTMKFDEDILKKISDEFAGILPPIREDKTKLIDFRWALEQFSRKKND